jgi:hypothetical protein
MIEANSLTSLLIQFGVLIILGGLVALIVRLLRFRHTERAASNRWRGALWAILAISIGWLLVMAIIFATGGDEPVKPSASSERPPPGPEDVLGQLIAAIVAVAPILLVMRGRQESLRSAGVTGENLGRSIVVGAFLVSAFALWRVIMVGGAGDAGLSPVGGVWALLQFAIVGFSEEFAYRGYLQGRLAGWLGTYRGWVLASAIMAMAHVGHRVAALGMSGGEALLSAAFLLPVSLFLGYVMLRTRSIVAPGLLHTFINWFGL